MDTSRWSVLDYVDSSWSAWEYDDLHWPEAEPMEEAEENTSANSANEEAHLPLDRSDDEDEDMGFGWDFD